MALTATNNVTLAGGLRDQDVVASLQNFIPEVWGASIMDFMQKNLVFGALCNDQSAMVANGGDRIHLPQHTELTASDTYGGVTAGIGAVETLIDTALAFPKTSANDGEYTLDINQAIHSAIAITDIANVQSSYDVMNIYTSKLGYALAKKIDAQVAIALFEHIAYNYANGTDDGSGAGNMIAMNDTHDEEHIELVGISNMIEAIYTNDSQIDDWTMVLTPKMYGSLFKLSDFARYDAIGNSQGSEVPIVSGYAGKLGGVKVVIANNFQHYGAGSSTQATSSTPVGNFWSAITDESQDLLGFLVHKDAAHIAYARGMKARVQSDYDLGSLSARFVADSVFGTLVTGSATNGNKRVFGLSSPAS